MRRLIERYGCHLMLFAQTCDQLVLFQEVQRRGHRVNLPPNTLIHLVSIVDLTLSTDFCKMAAKVAWQF